MAIADKGTNKRSGKTILNLIWHYTTSLFNKNTEQILHGLQPDRQSLNINSEYGVVEHVSFQ